MSNVVKPGDVFNYHYLWKWQSDAGETEGRKSRPVCVSVVVTNADNETIIFVAAITSKVPRQGWIGLEVPQTEAVRAGLSIDTPIWIMVDELNVDCIERSFTFEARAHRGHFSRAFTEHIARAIQSVRKTGGLTLLNRT